MHNYCWYVSFVFFFFFKNVILWIKIVFLGGLQWWIWYDLHKISSDNVAMLWIYVGSIVLVVLFLKLIWFGCVELSTTFNNFKFFLLSRLINPGTIYNWLWFFWWVFHLHSCRVQRKKDLYFGAKSLCRCQSLYFHYFGM